MMEYGELLFHGLNIICLTGQNVNFLMVLVQILCIKNEDGPLITFFSFFLIHTENLNHATKFCKLYHFAETQVCLILIKKI